MVAAAGILVLRMFIAAISGMGAATVCHPLDVIRVQLQTEGNSFTGPVDCAKGIIKTGKGPMALYAGIGAAYLRQWLYVILCRYSFRRRCLSSLSLFSPLLLLFISVDLLGLVQIWIVSDWDLCFLVGTGPEG